MRTAGGRAPDPAAAGGSVPRPAIGGEGGRGRGGNSRRAADAMPRLKFLILGGLLILAVVMLVGTATSGSMLYYRTVEELHAEAASLTGRPLRVTGELVPGSARQQPGGLRVEFMLQEGVHRLPVVYEGALPDTFHTAESVVAEGVLDPGGVFQAHTLLVQCPSKYEAEGPAE